MADGLVNMSAEFGGLPMDQLIGAPLKAACDAQTLLARASADFIRDVGMQQVGDGKTPNQLVARTVDFSFDRPKQDGSGTESVDLKVPLLAIVNTPSLSVKEVNIEFTMGVKSSTSSTDSSSKEASLDASASGGWGPFKAEVKVHGAVATKSENTRSSDNSAKYDVKVVARDDGMPEGLRRVLDMLNNSIAPVASKSLPAGK